MNRLLQYVNLAGVGVLAVLCAAQWRVNRRLNLQTIAMEITGRDQAAKIGAQERVIRGEKEDLEEFRGRLELAEAQLKTVGDKLAAATGERDRLSAERDQLKAAIAQVKAVVDRWAAAVAQRDRALVKANEQIRRLIEDRNAAVGRFNDLAGQYNALVKELNQARSSSRPS